MGPTEEAIAKDNADKEHVPAAICARFRKAIVIYLIDPEIDLATGLESGHPKDINRKYLWKGESKIGVVNEPSMKERTLGTICLVYLSWKTFVRDLRGYKYAPRRRCAV